MYALIALSTSVYATMTTSENDSNDQFVNLSNIRPVNVPKDFVATPDGYFHRSCVHEIQNDEVVDSGLLIEQPDRIKRQLAQCQYPNFSLTGRERQSTTLPETLPDLTDGWQLAASYTIANNESLGNLTTLWNVPAAPIDQEDQLLYFFPGVVQIPVVTILQPVLGWNQLGIAGWSVASWNCCEKGTIYHSAPIKVAAGSTVEGKIIHEGKDYLIQTIANASQAGQKMTQLRTRNYTQPVDWVFGGVMENYGLNSCSALPANGSIAFQHIDVYDRNHNRLKQPFQPQYYITACSYSIVIQDGSDQKPMVKLGWNPQ